jgi:hypothetical protein
MQCHETTHIRLNHAFQAIIVVYRRPVLLPPLGLEILKKRSVRGEINRQEFEDMTGD